MVLTRSHYENMSKEELIEHLVTHDDIIAKLSELTKRFEEFSLTSTKPSILKSKLLRIAIPFFWDVFTICNVMLLVFRSTTGEKH